MGPAPTKESGKISKSIIKKIIGRDPKGLMPKNRQDEDIVVELSSSPAANHSQPAEISDDKQYHIK
jgi:hypothetical protein